MKLQYCKNFRAIVF